MTTVLLFIRNPDGSYIPFYRDRRARGEQQAHIDFGFHFGIQLRGWPVLTVARGRIVAEDGVADEEARGAGRCVTVPES